ncbi:MAG TPA: PAS domain-containing protein, partial [Bdellovibrionota bacterium]|nr:PAS domain-containing protein [Bdellovibrionota bacterium]
NSYLANGPEALYAVKAAELFKKGQERGVAWEIDSETVAAYEPVKVINPTKGRNEIVAMAIVSIDTTLATESIGEMGMVYSETLILTGVLAFILLLILYKLTIKPFQVLVDDMDRVLKGDMSQVTQEFKFEEMNPLWELINSALSRVPKRGADMLGGALAQEQDPGITVDEAVAPMREMAEAAGFAVAVCGKDRRVTYLNPLFEEITGIRADAAVGEELAGLARDQAFAALITDLLERSASAGPVGEDFEFSGVGFRVQAVAVGSDPTSPKAYVLTLTKGAES